ncbi:MAG: 1-deoxy-D-xylulose-5-phosphate reductoisomerase [Candidatus Kapaibacterium sp.]
MENSEKTISILGSTGSIGVQALDVLDNLPAKYNINYLTVNKNIDLLAKQIERYNPRGVAIGDESAYRDFKNKYDFKGRILCGDEGIIEASADDDNDVVLSSLVGFSGVIPTLAAIEKGKTIALANKETLVSAGEIITKKARAHKAPLIAVDSEHSAVLQCLVGETNDEIEKIILTASGGPFRETPKCEFQKLTVKQALDHPNWSMGSKITIDSATMMNKGFEIIEAYWLFKVGLDDIEALIHPQSIIHSMVQFVDGSVKAQLGMPDMRIPISYALNYPRRLKFNFPRLDLSEIGCLNFMTPDPEKFPCLEIAYEALRIGGNAPAIINAANEIAVEAFLNERIRFSDIPDIIERSLSLIDKTDDPSIHDIIATDSLTRKYASDFINKNLVTVY